MIDLAAERARLAKEMAKCDADIARVDAKLGNPNFVARAPEEVVEEEKEKRDEAQARKAKIAEALEQPHGRGVRPMPMRIFLAGATGVIGVPLTPLLLAAGHAVSGTTRSAEKAAGLKTIGVEAIVVDVFDAAALRDAVVGARPEVVIHQLTDLPASSMRHNSPQPIRATRASAPRARAIWSARRGPLRPGVSSCRVSPLLMPPVRSPMPKPIHSIWPTVRVS